MQFKTTEPKLMVTAVLCTKLNVLPLKNWTYKLLLISQYMLFLNLFYQKEYFYWIKKQFDFVLLLIKGTKVCRAIALLKSNIIMQKEQHICHIHWSVYNRNKNFICYKMSPALFHRNLFSQYLAASVSLHSWIW